MDGILSSLLASSLVIYGGIIFYLALGLKKLRSKPGAVVHDPSVSVIVAARNESENLNRLLPILRDQTYRPIEIIIINDRSSDNTIEVVNRFISEMGNLKRIDVTREIDGLSGKKNALFQGIQASRGEILLFTDADCLPTKLWVEKMTGYFSNEVGFVTGFVRHDRTLSQHRKTTSFATMLFSFFYEFLGLKNAIGAAGAIGMNRAWLCSGGNLAYRRSLFEQVGGFTCIKHSRSGDDDLFIQHVRKHSTLAIRYATDPDTFVKTEPVPDFSTFLEQRKRHHSAGTYYPLSLKIILFLFHLSNLSILIGSICFLFFSQNLRFLSSLYVIKILIDLSVINSANAIFRRKEFLFWNLFLEIFYILYNTLIAPLGLFRSFRWK
jgi:cellulose synthase/poly-beta-1,6-N-acetylglucosamine synthase-like glycosyltransferase